MAEIGYCLYGLTLRTAFPFRFHFLPSGESTDLRFVYHGVTPETVPPGTELTARSSEEDNRREIMRLYRSGTTEIIYFPGIATFRCLESEIHAWAFAEGLEYMVEICLVGNVMAYWMERRGVIALHASAVVVAGRAIAFMAGTSRGKTTTACAFLVAGHPLVTDDILPLRVSPEGVTALPGFPQMKLLPQQLDLLEPGTLDFKKVHPLFEKLMVPIGSGIGHFYDHPEALAGVYLLDRDDEGECPECTSLGRGEAFVELLRHSFAAELVDVIDRGQDRFNKLSTISRLVPMKRLRIPAGYDKLDRVVTWVTEDLTGNKLSPAGDGPELVE